MNCKQGDLAVIVRSVAGNEGKIVTCLRVATEKETSDVSFNPAYLPVWVIDAEIPSLYGFKVALAPDAFLRPIRDNDGEDEMLRIAGLPNKQPEVA